MTEFHPVQPDWPRWNYFYPLIRMSPGLMLDFIVTHLR